MKNKFSVQLWKTVAVALLTVMLVISVFHLIGLNETDVYAAEDVTTDFTPENVDYKLIWYSEIDSYRTENATDHTAVVSIPDEYSDGKEWIFAGWYADKELNNNIKRNVTSGKGYAKFVCADILSVKCQTSKGTEPSSPNTVLRCVSSVDSLKYNRIGFDIITPDADGNLVDDNIPEKSDNKVGVRIYANTEEDSYTYSPKVVDTESEYFFSTTITVNNDKFAYRHLIKPYWITKDGTKVYGVSRYVTVNEGLNKDIIHATIKMPEPEATNSYTTDVTGATVTYIDHDGTYAHFAISVSDRTALNSVTKFVISDTENELGTCYYRNLLTSYNGSNADKSWYDAYKDGEGNLTEDEFVIVTSADLYGFASVAVSNDKTFYLASDIVVNEDTIDPKSSDWNTMKLSLTKWHSEAYTDATAFTGVFDGQEHTISGLYATHSNINHALGLFGKVKDAEIRNVRIVNSYFDGTYPIGSIVGQGSGKFENIYSDVTINATTEKAGGIAGYVNGKSDLQLCWYEGNISTSKNSGGIIGEISSSKASTVTMTNCLYTGSLTSSSTDPQPYVSGFVGKVGNLATLSINTSLATGIITLSDKATHAWKGWAVSYTQQNGGDVTITDSYAYKNGLTRAVGTGGTLYLNTGLEADKIKGDALIDATSGLDWEETYATRHNGKAALRGLISEDSLAIYDTAWYDSATENKDGDKPGTENNPYVLRKASELYGFAKLVNEGNNFDGKYIELAKDITVNNQTIDPTSEGWASLSIELRTWNPIAASAEHAFQGIFNGKGHTISGLYASGATDEAIGLFGHINDAQIKNLRLTNSYFNGVNQVASIAGQGNGRFENIYSNVGMDAEIQAGGIVGYVNGNSDLVSCWYEGTLITRYHSGGIIGSIGSSEAVAEVTMTNCLNAGSIVSSTSSSDNTNYSSVTSSHVKYNTPYVSGFVGYVHDSSLLNIQTSLSVGTITQNATGIWRGWAVSYTQQSGRDVTITDSYAYTNELSRAIGTESSLYKDSTKLEAEQIKGDALIEITKEGLNWTDIYVLQINGNPGIKSLIVK